MKSLNKIIHFLVGVNAKMFEQQQKNARADHME